MKKLYILSLITLFVCFAKAQDPIVNIPDPLFKAKLLEAAPYNYIAKDLNGNYFKIDANNDNEIQVSEAEQVSYLNVLNSSVYDFKINNSI